MKKIVLFVIAMLAAVMPMKADYTLQFVESSSSSDATTAYATEVSAVFTDASNVVGEITNLAKVYPAKTGYGAKFGSSTAVGNLKFTILEPHYIAAILKVAPYSATASITLLVNGEEFPVTASADGGFTEITYSPGSSFESLEITTTNSGSTGRFYVASITLVEQGSNGGGTSVLKGNAVWPLFMDETTRLQESNKIVADFTVDNQECFLYNWEQTYEAQASTGLNFYGNADGFLSLTVQSMGWSGFGQNVPFESKLRNAAVNLWQNILSSPKKYYLHLAIKSTDYASHDFYVFGDEATRFTIGTTAQDPNSIVIGDFARNGEWHEFDIPMSMFTMSSQIDTTLTTNILIALSGGVAGTQLNLDAVYFYEQDGQPDGGDDTGDGTSVLKGNAVWPIFMDGITRQQESSKIVADFTNDEQERNFYIWNNTYQGENVYGGNFYDNGDVYLSLTVQNEGWSGFGMNILAGNNSWDAAVNLWQNIRSNPEKYYLHMALKSTDYASHDFYVFDDLTTRFTIGTSPQDSSSVIIGDFARDGEWHEFDIPMSMFAMSPDFTSTDGMNIFIALSGGVAGTQLNLDAVYFYEVSDSQGDDEAIGGCLPVTKFPWEENFDVTPAPGWTIPACWDNSIGSQSMAEDRKWSYYTGTLNSQCVRFDSYNNQEGETNTLQTPTMTLPQGMALFVKYKNPKGGDFNIYMYGADGSATILKSGLVGVANWKIEKIDLSQYAGQTVSFGFEGISNWGYDDAYIYIDRVAVMSNKQELDTESDPDFGPQIIIEEYETLRVEPVRVGLVESGWYDVSVANMQTLPTVTSMNSELLTIDHCEFVDANGGAVSNPADAEKLRIYFFTTPTETGYLEGNIAITAGQITKTLPFVLTATPLVEIVPLGVEGGVLLTGTPGSEVQYTLKFLYRGFTPDQITIGFPYGVSTEGYQLGQMYSLNDSTMAVDISVGAKENGVFSTQIMLEAHGYICFTDVYEYVNVKTIIADSWIQKLTEEINFGVLPLNSGVYMDTVYLKYHNVDFTTTSVGSNILPYEGQPYIPCGVGSTVVLNDSILAIPVSCNTNIVEAGAGRYSLRFYYAASGYNGLTDDNTDIPVKVTFVPQPSVTVNRESVDFGGFAYAEPFARQEAELSVSVTSYHRLEASISGDASFSLGKSVFEVTDNQFGEEVEFNLPIYFEAKSVGSVSATLILKADGEVVKQIPLSADVWLEPEYRMPEELDFGTMLFDDTKTMKLQFEARYCDIRDIEVSSSNEILAVGNVTEIADSIADTSLGAWKRYEVSVTLNAYEVGDLYLDLFYRFNNRDGWVTVKAFIPQPTVTIVQEAYDFGKVPQNSGAYPAQLLVTFSNALPARIGYDIRNQNEADTSWIPVGFADRVLRDSTTLVVNMMLNSDGLAIGEYDWFFFVSYGKEIYMIPVMANIVQASQIEIIPEVIDFGDVPFSSLVNDYISTEVKIATTSVHQAVASIEGDSAFSLSQFTFGPTESYFGNRLEQDLTIYALPDRMGQHMAELKLNGDSGKTVAIAQVKMNVVPREVLYDTIRATICDNESYPFAGEMIWDEGIYSETTKTIYGGDSVTTLILTVLPSHHGDVYASVRDYEYYFFHGDTIREAGDYRYPMPQAASNGCDSTVTLHLTVLETMYRTEEATICSNSSYTFYGEVYNQAGKYEHRIENTQLGDSVITLNLTVLPTKTGEDFATIRDYEEYEYEGQKLTEAGNYEFTLVAENGCDSVVTLHLTVLETMYRTEEATICANQSYTFYGEVYNQAGKYEHRIENTQLGDSVITLNLTVLPTKTGEEFATIRDYEEYEYEGQKLTEAGNYEFTLVAANGCDSVVTLHLTVLETMYRTEEATICANQSYTFYGEVYTESGVYEHRFENRQEGDSATGEGVILLGDSVITLNLTVLPMATAELEATIIEPESYWFGGKALTEAGVYVDTLVAANGCDSVVTLTLYVIPSCSEYVVANAPEEVVYYTDEAVTAPVITLLCPSRDAVIEWGVVRNYNPTSSGKVDVTNPVEYEMLQSTPMNEYQGDTLSSRFNYYVLDRTQYFYYLIWQCDSVKEMHLFRFEHVGQVNSIWVNYDAPKREQPIRSEAMVSVDGGEAQAVTVAWYNTQDTVNVATGNFVHGQTYYAVVTTPMSEFLGENYYIDATTAIVWGEEQQPKALVDGQLCSPMYTMENITWTFRLEDAQLAPDGQASITACAEPSVSISGSSSVVLNWELSLDNQNWLTLSDTLGYNIDFDSYCTDIHFPATLLRAGTYYIRVRAQYGSEVFFSRTAELVIKAGIVMAEEAVQQTTVTETGEEVATVQYMFDETEEVGVLTLTNSSNEGSATTAVAITSNTVVEIVGTNTVVSDEAGFESSGDLEFVGRIDSTQVDEDGHTIYAALDSMSIVSKRPLYAPGSGVKITFNGVYMVLTTLGHEDDNLIPSRSAARAQMKRAYSIAHAALEAAGDESVISGFDEADFINCGIIEPDGAEYDEDNLELMDDGDPVYNCTIAPMDIPTDPMSNGMVKDAIGVEKRVVNDLIYIYRQGKVYTMMGQRVE